MISPHLPHFGPNFCFKMEKKLKEGRRGGQSLGYLHDLKGILDELRVEIVFKHFFWKWQKKCSVGWEGMGGLLCTSLLVIRRVESCQFKAFSAPYCCTILVLQWNSLVHLKLSSWNGMIGNGFMFLDASEIFFKGIRLSIFLQTLIGEHYAYVQNLIACHGAVNNKT